MSLTNEAVDALDDNKDKDYNIKVLQLLKKIELNTRKPV